MAAATSVIMDRLVGFFGMILRSIFAILSNFEVLTSRHELILLSSGVFSLFAIFCVLFVTVFARRLRRVVEWICKSLPGGKWFQRFYDIIHLYRSSPSTLALSLGLTLFSQSL